MMKAAVICEFNPFHNGHKFLLEKIKESYADEIICIMSGSCVQRGSLAITDKYTRAETALRNGADMVVELPTVYAMSSARPFAESGVRIAEQLGCEVLCFGAESELSVLRKLKDACEDNAVNAIVKQKMDAGLYYPRALSEAVNEVCGAALSQAIMKPNNILALEYIRACRTIRPIAIERKDAMHDSTTASDTITSGKDIRRMILSGESYDTYTPMTVTHPADERRIEGALLYRLKTMPHEKLSAIAGVSEGLEYRVKECATKYNSIEEILEHLKTKRYTRSRLRRILYDALLGVTGRMQQTPVPYLRVIGVKKEKSELIPSAGPMAVVKVKADYEKLDNSAKEIFDVDIRATELMNIAQDAVPINEFSRGLIKG